MRLKRLLKFDMLARRIPKENAPLGKYIFTHVLRGFWQMKKKSGVIFTMFLVAVIAVGMGACASKEKTAEGPEAGQAAEAKRGTVQGTVEVQPSSQELKRQQEEEAARQKRVELDKMKEEELAKASASNGSADAAGSSVSPVSGALAPEKLEKVYFDFDKYEIQPDFRAPLERNAAALKEHAMKVVVEGHCDERGSEEYNLALGERRSMAVKAFLVSLGVKEGQLYTISYGEERPVDKGHNEKAWAQNRRVQFAQE